jgi:hypothetical protein
VLNEVRYPRLGGVIVSTTHPHPYVKGGDRCSWSSSNTALMPFAGLLLMISSLSLAVSLKAGINAGKRGVREAKITRAIFFMALYFKQRFPIRECLYLHQAKVADHFALLLDFPS